MQGGNQGGIERGEHTATVNRIHNSADKPPTTTDAMRLLGWLLLLHVIACGRQPHGSCHSSQFVSNIADGITELTCIRFMAYTC